MTPEPVTLEFIARQLERVLTEQADMRDQMTVLTAMVMRIEVTVHALEIEVRAMHSRLDRLANRVRTLEEKASP
jgi:septal ring factor EnvC (AmiA/AmiB activator)